MSDKRQKTDSKLELSSNTLSEDEASVASVLKEHLDAKIDNLEFDVTSRLSAARHRALAVAENENPKSTRLDWLTGKNRVAGFALGVIALVVGSQLIPGMVSTAPDFSNSSEQLADVNPSTQETLFQDLPILSSNDDIDFYQSMELLEWMDSNSG